MASTRPPIRAYQPALMLEGNRRLRDTSPFLFEVARASAVC